MNFGNKYPLFYNDQFYLINFAFVAILLLFTLFIIWNISAKNKRLKFRVLFLSLCYHTFMSVYYYFGTLYSAADATRYYLDTINTTSSFIGNYGHDIDFIVFTLYPFVIYFKLSYFSCFMLFNVIGFLGIILFYMTLKETIPSDNKADKYVNLALFLPGLNFWTGAIGKDAYIMFALGLILYSLVNLRKRFIILILGLVLAAHIRPYVFMLLISCFFGAILVSSAKIGVVGRVLLILVMISLMVPGYHFFLSEIKLTALDAEIVKNYFGDKQIAFGGGGSDIDFSNYNIVFKVFSFLYRPLFLDAHSINTFIASIENAIYLFITMSMLRVRFIKYIFQETSILIRFSLFYSIMGTIVMSYATNNLGTATRIKNMIIITILILGLEYFAKKNETNTGTTSFTEGELIRLRNTRGSLPPHE